MHGEHAAPRLTEHVDAIEAKLRAHRVDFVDERLHLVEVGVGGPVRAAATDLIVEDHAPAEAREFFQGLEILVRGTGSAVQHQQGQPSRRALADRAIPRPVSAKGDKAFGGRHAGAFAWRTILSVTNVTIPNVIQSAPAVLALASAFHNT